MSDITVHFRDGTKREFKHEGRAGGSYTKSVRYEAGFVIVENEWGATTVFPSELVKSVETTEQRRW